MKNGEGVYGLRRAFVLAGTETLVMSLWPVSDYVTREMMSAYYKGLKQGQGRGEALRQVQLSMLKKRGREHPFYGEAYINRANGPVSKANDKQSHLQDRHTHRREGARHRVMLHLIGEEAAD